MTIAFWLVENTVITPGRSSTYKFISWTSLIVHPSSWPPPLLKHMGEGFFIHSFIWATTKPPPIRYIVDSKTGGMSIYSCKIHCR